jgi:hypothetical protein
MWSAEVLGRRLRSEEIVFARRVFGETLPYDKIVLVNQTGKENRPCTQAQLAKKNYYLHVGPLIFFDATSAAPWSYSSDGVVRERRCDVFIHELTHVWQGEYQPAVLIPISLYHLPPSKEGYSYELGQPWSSYNAEQQAQIIEDWFNPRIGCESQQDARYRYIIENLRARNPR